MTLITDKNWLNPILSEQLPQSLLDRAEALPAKTAFLVGCLAPETASRLGRLLHGNGRVSRMVTHLQQVQLGLQPHLWSLSRGLARRHQEYYSALSNADRPREGDHDGRGQLSQKHYFAFIEFMLDVCHDQVDYMIAALNREKLRERVIRAFKTHERLLDAGIKPETAPAVIVLLMQGSLPRSEFKIFTGLPPRGATDELTRLVKAGVVVSPTPKSRTVEPGLPVWFAQTIFADLHVRIKD